ncbi:hypothetical protein [Streptomyces sp. NPDC052107]|uniref:hypothetical protein n=1 Tax=Streptomyces sp. NPDC052107 TaxID=3155632 RepID=UPI0034252214
MWGEVAGSPAVQDSVDGRPAARGGARGGLGVWGEVTGSPAVQDSVDGRPAARDGARGRLDVWGEVTGTPGRTGQRRRPSGGARGRLDVWAKSRGDMPTMLPRPLRSSAAATRRDPPGPTGTRRSPP